MKKYYLYILIIPAILSLSGCLNLSKNEPKKKVSIENKTFNLEVADTEAERETGLMNRKSLLSNEGMLFVFDQKDYLQFWMKNTLIPLQILMIDDCTIVDQIEMKKEDDPSNAKIIYKSKKPANKAIELNSRTFTKDLIGKKIPELCN